MKLLSFLLFLHLSLLSGYAQHVDKTGNKHECSPLFEKDSVLLIKMRYSKKELLTYANDSNYIKTTFSYSPTHGSIKSLESEIRLRGGYRRTNCYYPPLWLKIQKTDSKETLFQDDKKLKIVLPCLKSKKSNDDVLKEFLAYKIYELISIYHLDTRLLEIELEETKNDKTIDHKLIGFFIQDIKKAASLNQARVLKRNSHPQTQDPINSSRNAMFQYMIGNTDYSTTYRHNEKLIFVDGKIVPIPYDFDMSGFVNTSYAVVSEINNKTLPITKVTDRFYLGYDRGHEVLMQTRKEFLDLEDDIFNLIQAYEKYFTDPKEYKECKTYLASFFQILKDDKKFRNRITKQQLKKLE